MASKETVPVSVPAATSLLVLKLLKSKIDTFQDFFLTA